MHSKVLQCLSPPAVKICPSASAWARMQELGNDAVVFPDQMHCIGRISPAQLVVTIKVNCCFSSFPNPSTCFSPCSAHVYLLKGMIDTPVWSPFKIASAGVSLI